MQGNAGQCVSQRRPCKHFAASPVAKINFLPFDEVPTPALRFGWQSSSSTCCIMQPMFADVNEAVNHPHRINARALMAAKDSETVQPNLTKFNSYGVPRA